MKEISSGKLLTYAASPTGVFCTQPRHTAGQSPGLAECSHQMRTTKELLRPCFAGMLETSLGGKDNQRAEESKYKHDEADAEEQVAEYLGFHDQGQTIEEQGDGQ